MKFALIGMYEMPALLGYLVALAVFLGSGYAGLEWLASPDDASTHQHLSDKPTSHHAGPQKSAVNVEGTNQAVPRAKDENAAPRTGAPDQANREEAKATATASGTGGEISGVDKPDAVPSGGCMPIGLTAKGEMVFPLQCREVIEHQRGPVAVASTPPVQAASAPARIEVEVSGKPKEGGNAVSDADLKPESKSDAPVVEPERVEGNKQAKPTSDSKGEKAERKSNELDGGYRAVSPHSNVPSEVLATNTVKPRNGQKFEDDIKPKKSEKQKLGADRRKLVLMRLETLQFSDGHREQRLLPLRQSRSVALQSEWYNPLGLR